MECTQKNLNRALYVMVGVAASGKSYKARTLMSKGVDYVSRDEIRYSIIGEDKWTFSKEKQVFREFIKRVQSSLDGGRSVIADATHINKKARKKLLASLELDGVSVIAVYCDVDFETCFERNSKRVGVARVPDSAMYDMRERLTEPFKEEGFDLIIKMSEEAV